MQVKSHCLSSAKFTCTNLPAQIYLHKFTCTNLSAQIYLHRRAVALKELRRCSLWTPPLELK